MQSGAKTKSSKDARSDSDILDLEHLDQYTLGDEKLQCELIGLFSLQLENQTVELEKCASADDWRAAAHTLKGAARAIGARQVADLAEQFEDYAWTDIATRKQGLADLARARARFEAQAAELK